MTDQTLIAWGDAICTKCGRWFDYIKQDRACRPAFCGECVAAAAKSSEPPTDNRPICQCLCHLNPGMVIHCAPCCGDGPEYPCRPPPFKFGGL